MNWKTDLDRYLTTPPDDGFDTWCDMVTEAFTEDFYTKNEDWILEYAGVCNKWLNKLHYRCPKEVAKIIERAFHIHIKK